MPAIKKVRLGIAAIIPHPVPPPPSPLEKLSMLIIEKYIPIMHDSIPANKERSSIILPIIFMLFFLILFYYI